MESDPMDARIEEAVNGLNEIADQYNVAAISRAMFIIGFLRGENETLKMRLKWAELDRAKYQQEVYRCAYEGVFKQNADLKQECRDLEDLNAQLSSRCGE